MCNQDDFKYLADMIEHVPLPLRTRYVFCCAPISKKHPFTCSMFLKVNTKMTLAYRCKQSFHLNPSSPPSHRKLLKSTVHPSMLLFYTTLIYPKG